MAMSDTQQHSLREFLDLLVLCLRRLSPSCLQLSILLLTKHLPSTCFGPAWDPEVLHVQWQHNTTRAQQVGVGRGKAVTNHVNVGAEWPERASTRRCCQAGLEGLGIGWERSVLQGGGTSSPRPAAVTPGCDGALVRNFKFTVICLCHQ